MTYKKIEPPNTPASFYNTYDAPAPKWESYFFRNLWSWFLSRIPLLISLFIAINIIAHLPQYPTLLALGIAVNIPLFLLQSVWPHKYEKVGD